VFRSKGEFMDLVKEKNKIAKKEKESLLLKETTGGLGKG